MIISRVFRQFMDIPFRWIIFRNLIRCDGDIPQSLVNRLKIIFHPLLTIGIVSAIKERRSIGGFIISTEIG